MTDDYVASHNAHTGPGCDVIIAIRDENPAALADAIELEGDVHDGSARDLLLACLSGSDRATEIVNQRKAGGRYVRKYPFPLDEAWFSQGLNAEARRGLIMGLRAGHIIIRTKTCGKAGPRPKVFTEQVCKGAAIEDRAVKWAVKVKGLNPFDLRSGRVPMPRRALAAALRVSATLKRLKADSSQVFDAQSENRDFAVVELQKALSAWRKLARR